MPTSPATSFELEMQIVDVARKHIDSLRALKLEATRLRNEDPNSKEGERFEKIRELLDLEEEMQIELYRELLPESMKTLN